MDQQDFARHRDLRWTFPISLLFFLLVLLALYRESTPDWLPIQRRFRQLLEQHAQLAAAREFTLGVKQIWLPALNRVDRCVTCHLGYEWAGILPADLPQPFAPHPFLPYAEAHPFTRFGCTTCHGGQSYATEMAAAHGEVAHWEDPLLSRRFASQYGLSQRELMQAKCNSCHRHDKETRDMEMVNIGKQLLEERRCIACHVISGQGGLIGPELTYEGDKNPEFFDFTRVEGVETALNWHIQHFQNPQKVVPGSAMPPFSFSAREARALAVLMVSWKRENFPPEYAPLPYRLTLAGVPPVVREIPIPPQEKVVTRPEEEGRKIFQTRGCHSCHTIGKGKLIGPDLQGVTKRRDEEWIRRWLADPAAMIRASPELQGWPQEYGGIIMPNQNLATTEIQALIAYMKTF